MMELTVKINDNSTYKLSKWDASEFKENFVLYLQSNDFASVKQDFTNINKIDIFMDSTQLGEFTSFDTFTQMTYLGNMFVEGEKRFAETIAVTLGKANLIDVVNRLDKKINPVLDPTTMSLAEMKEYYKELVAKDYLADITHGVSISLSNGASKLFSMSPADQMNIMNIYAVVISSDGKITEVPYNGATYTTEDIMKIYLGMQEFINEKNIRLDLVNKLIDKAADANELENYSYNMEFTGDTASLYSYLVTAALNNIGHIGTEPGGAADSKSIDEFLDIVYDGE